jgi:quercetin dioxygenase-like cupin family protein
MSPRILISREDGIRLPGGGIVKFGSQETAGALAAVEVVVAPRHLISHHVHANDVWIYVLSGEVGVLVGEDIAVGGAGSWLLKPRDVPHAMWNTQAEPARILELLTPAGSENFYIEASGAGDQAAFDEVCRRYGIRFFADSEWNQKLREKFGLTD